MPSHLQAPLSFRPISLVTKHYSGCTFSYVQAHHSSLTAMLYKHLHQIDKNNAYLSQYFLLDSQKTLQSCINPRLLTGILWY